MTSKKAPNPELQKNFRSAGSEGIFEEQISSRKAVWPRLWVAMGFYCEGDNLVVWKLDRLGHCLQELVELVVALK